MTFFISTRDRLAQASDIATVLDAAYGAFEGMRLGFRAHEDRATGLFGVFVMAAAFAADGRDAVWFAPSLLSRRRHGAVGNGEGAPGGEGAERIAADAASLSQLLVVCLTRAAGSASDPGDRGACEQAARCAREICDLLGGVSP